MYLVHITQYTIDMAVCVYVRHKQTHTYVYMYISIM